MSDTENMVIVQLNGGLGNQMFQYANGRAIAFRNQVALGLDTSILQRSYSRPYKLCYFNVSAELVSPEQVRRVIEAGTTKASRLKNSVAQSLKPYYRRKIFRERLQGYDPNILKAIPPVYLAGYWQSEEYFKDIEGIIREELRHKQPPDAFNLASLGEIQATNSVSVHVRRGDYVTNPKTNQVHGLCTLDYYDRAVQIMAEKVEHPHFYIFSDDSEWSQTNLKLNFPTRFVSHNGIEMDYEDLRLMSHCKHHILANSSFSWWGAWLSGFSQKIVIAPIHWFNDPSLDSRHALPRGWIRI